MTNQEAIEIVKTFREAMDSPITEYRDILLGALDMAIEALENERPKGKCKDCKNYYPYFEQFTNKPRGDGFCGNLKMTSDGYHYINCDDNWCCANFCPKEDMRGNDNDG